MDLGEHQGHRVVARVEHRTLRVALGRRWSGTVTLGQRRATRLTLQRISGPVEGTRYDVAIPRPADPWARYAQRVALVAGACWVALRLARRWRRSARMGVASRAPDEGDLL